MLSSGDHRELYESAISHPASRGALLHVGRDTFFAGALDSIGLHSHAVPVYLAGLYDDFRVRIEGGTWLICRTAVVPAGVVHELEAGNMPLAVFYPDAGRTDLSGLTALVAQRLDDHSVVAGRTGETGLFRELYECGRSHSWTGEALTSLLASSVVRRRGCVLDKRLGKVIEMLHGEPDSSLSVGQVAATQGLSPSRLMHLFTGQIGVPYRRYRLWSRLQLSMRLVASGQNLTSAAIAAGFYDSQHFSREFRRSLGIPASGLLRRVERISW